MEGFDLHSLFIVSQPLTLTTWFKACIILYASQTLGLQVQIPGSMDVYLHFVCVCVALRCYKPCSGPVPHPGCHIKYLEA